MKKTVYVIKKLGFGKSTLYLILYPLRFLRKTLKKLDDLHTEIRWHRKVSEYLQIAGILRETQNNQHSYSEAKDYFKGYGFELNTDWLLFYRGLLESKSNYYIPDNIFFHDIEPLLNNRSLTSYYTDKNNYGLLLKDFRKPATILRSVNGNFFDQKYNQLSEEEAKMVLNKAETSWVIKPSVGSGGGKGVHIGNSKRDLFQINNKTYTFTALNDMYKRGYIIQKKVEQHRDLAQFHKASLNTFRVITLRLNNQIHYLSGVLKFGVNNNIVDNSITGAIWCGMNRNGSMKPYGMTKKFKRITTHPTTGEFFDNVHFTFYPYVLEFAKSMHNHLIHLDIVSWDIGVDYESHPVLIEFNLKSQGIIGCQAVNGPLFGDLTDDVLAEVVRRRSENRG